MMKLLGMKSPTSVSALRVLLEARLESMSREASGEVRRVADGVTNIW
jgi:hypothetical protein